MICGNPVSHGGYWTMYYSDTVIGSCSSSAVSIQCNDWYYAWPWSARYCSCTSYCPASWGCGQTAAWWKCTSYQYPTHISCSTYSKTSTCQSNWTWSSTPYSYGDCKKPVYCPASWWCSALAPWSTCTTYSVSQVSTFASCTSYKRTSTCQSNWTWNNTPYAYSSCSNKPYNACDYACKSGWWCAAWWTRSWNTCSKSGSWSCSSCTFPSWWWWGWWCVTWSVANPC